MRTFLLILAGTTLAAAQERIYVAAAGDSKVAVVDGATNQVVGQIAVSPNPRSVAVSVDGKRIFVASEAKNAVDVVDRVTSKVLRSIPVGRKPGDILLAPEGRKLFVSTRGNGAVDVIDTASLEKEKSIYTGAEPAGLAITPDRTRLFAVSTGDKKLFVINIRTLSVEFSIPVEGSPIAVSFEADRSLATRRVFILLSGQGGIAIMDYAQRKVTGKVAGGARSLAVAPDSKTLWVSGADGTTVYTLPDVKKAITIQAGKNSSTIFFTRDGKRVIATDEDGSLAVMSVAGLKQLAKVPVGKDPAGFAVAE